VSGVLTRERFFRDRTLLTRSLGLSLKVSVVLLVRFRSLLRRLRLRFRFRSGFLLNNVVVSGLILFRSLGLLLLRSGVLRLAGALGLVLHLKVARLGLVLVLFLGLRGSVRRFRLGRVLGRSVILRVVRGSLVQLGLRLLSGRSSLVLMLRLFSRGRVRFLVGRCLGLGVRLRRLRKRTLVVRRTRISLGLRLAHLKHRVRRMLDRRTANPVSRALLVGRWTGILRLIRY
jgi:hypothetical protein